MLKLLILKKHFPEKPPKLDAEETTIWRDHEWVACMIHLWMSLDNSIKCQATKGSICPLREINILCPLTKWWWHPVVKLCVHWQNIENAHWRICWWWSPTSRRRWKKTHCFFCCVWKLLVADFAVDFPLANVLMLTRWWKFPLAASLMLWRLLISQPLSI